MTDTQTVKTIQVTAEGLEELKKELNGLQQVKLPEAVDRVAKAREYGDLSENSEYHSARDDQQLLEARIAEIEDVLSRAEVVKQTKSLTTIGVGSTVTVTPKGKKSKNMVFQIAGEYESNPGEGKISSVSPLGQALMGKKRGEVVKVKAPAGEVEYEVVDIK